MSQATILPCMESYSFESRKLMTPGPVPLPESVKMSFQKYECHHRSKEFQEILVRTLENLKKIFQTQQHCYLLSATGTGGLEAAMVNSLNSTQPALFINGGKFGERWGKIAKAFGIAFDELKLEWGKDLDLNELEDLLKSKDYQAVAWQACETSTGALLPTKAVAELCRKYNCLSMVDGITALGATHLPMDEWGIDVLVGGSQKAFMLPTGLSFISISERVEKAQSDIKSYYFDLKSEKAANLEGRTRYSTATQFVLSLDLVLKDILSQGFENHLMDIDLRARKFREATSLPLFPETPSPSLSCLKVPEGLSATKIRDQVYQEGYIIVAGQDQLKDRVLRVGHMGHMSIEDLTGVAQAIEKFL